MDWPSCDAEMLKTEIPSSDESIEHKLHHRQQRQSLAAALDELPPNNLQVVEDYYSRISAWSRLARN